MDLNERTLLGAPVIATRSPGLATRSKKRGLPNQRWHGVSQTAINSLCRTIQGVSRRLLLITLDLASFVLVFPLRLLLTEKDPEHCILPFGANAANMRTWCFLCPEDLAGKRSKMDKKRLVECMAWGSQPGIGSQGRLDRPNVFWGC